MATRSWRDAAAFLFAAWLASVPARAQGTDISLRLPGPTTTPGSAIAQPLKIRVAEPAAIKPVSQAPGPIELPTPKNAPPVALPPPAADDDTVIRINTAAPTPGDLFRLETEQQFRQRIVKETERWRDKVQIPELNYPASRPLPYARGWPSLFETAETSRLCYFRLGFAQPMSERYGQSIGPLQPFWSLGRFYGDIATWPARIVAPPWRCEKCDDLSDLTCYPRRTWPPAFMHD